MSFHTSDFPAHLQILLSSVKPELVRPEETNFENPRKMFVLFCSMIPNFVIWPPVELTV